MVVESTRATVPEWPQIVDYGRYPEQKDGWQPEKQVLEQEFADDDLTEAQAPCRLGYNSDVKDLLAESLAFDESLA